MKTKNKNKSDVLVQAIFKEWATEIGPYIKVTTDANSGAKVISIPFEFPDGIDGIMIVCKMTPLGWKPAEEIGNININFK